MQMLQTRLQLGAALLAAAAWVPAAAQTAVLAPSVPLTPAPPQPAAAPPSAATTVSPVLRISRFNADPQGGLTPGSTVRFTLDGTPGAVASVSMPGPDVAVPLREVQPGHYEGSHVLRPQDLSMPSPVVARLQLGNQQASAQLATQLAGSAPAADTRVLGAAAPMAPLTLQIITAGDTAAPGAGPVVIRGRTSPNAVVHARVNAVTPTSAASVAQPLSAQTAQADAEGNFSLSIAAQPMPAGSRLEVELRAAQGAQTSKGLRLVLFPRQG